jgi:hypothetical protein
LVAAQSQLLAATPSTHLLLAGLCLVNHLHRLVIWLLLAVVVAVDLSQVVAVLVAI